MRGRVYDCRESEDNFGRNCMNFPMNPIEERIIQYTQERAREQDEINKLKLPKHHKDPKFTDKLIEESKVVDLRDSSYPPEEKV